jgi:F-type H+-transporting ATPase subunit delta
MPNPRLATRYAKSLIDLALERGEIEQVHTDMQLLGSLMKSNRDFVNLLRSPVVNPDTKQRVLDAVIPSAGDISQMVKSFISLLIRKGRESNLPEVVSAFMDQYRVHKNIYTVHLTTATPVSDTVRNAIIAQVKKAGGFDNIELQEKVDESLIGGFVLQVGDKLVDASIAYDLKAIAKQFENNDFIYKIR